MVLVARRAEPTARREPGYLEVPGWAWMSCVPDQPLASPVNPAAEPPAHCSDVARTPVMAHPGLRCSAMHSGWRSDLVFSVIMPSPGSGLSRWGLGATCLSVVHLRGPCGTLGITLCLDARVSRGSTWEASGT